MFYDPRAVIPKVDNRVYGSYVLHVALWYFVCVKFQENISIGIRVIEQTQMIKALTDWMWTDGQTLQITEGLTKKKGAGA